MCGGNLNYTETSYISYKVQSIGYVLVILVYSKCSGAKDGSVIKHSNYVKLQKGSKVALILYKGLLEIHLIAKRMAINTYFVIHNRAVV